jgi:hypothetical protein
VPFLRLTRDRRGFENTFLMHADRPGDRPRLLYWYRTAPGIVLGRSPLDEDAIRTIEEQHPDIEFDWPAILALSEVMTPEDEAPARPAQPPRQQQQQQPGRRQKNREQRRDQRPPRDQNEAPSVEAPGDAPAEAAPAPEEEAGVDATPYVPPLASEDAEFDAPEPEPAPRPTTHGLLESLVGREIATRLRARFSEITARIHEQNVEGSLRDVWIKRAEPLNPDLWLTADAVLEGVRGADALFDRLRAELLSK